MQSGGSEISYSYSDRRYWDDRYASTLRRKEGDDEGREEGREEEEEPPSASCCSDEPDEQVFDWLCEPVSLVSFLSRALAGSQGTAAASNAVVVDLGCGNSELAETLVAPPGNGRGSEDSAAASFRAAFAIGADYSSSGVLDAMRERAASRGMIGRLDYVAMDATGRSALRDGAADVVLDKGCLDSVMQDYDQVRLSMKWQRQTSRDVAPLLEEDEARGKSITREACRILVPGGVFLMVSYEPPAGRLLFLSQPGLDWDVEVPGAEDDMGNYVYVCRKHHEAASSGADQGDVKAAVSGHRAAASVAAVELDELD